MTIRAPLVLAAILMLGSPACTRGEGEGEGGAPLPGSQDTRPFSAISEAEKLSFTGTEPFWGGEVEDTRLRYTTPEHPNGTMLEVTRFAGRGGLSYSGSLDGRAFDMAVTPGECSDGMSDRTYPFTVTLRLGEELRWGCGWTGRMPFEGSPAP